MDQWITKRVSQSLTRAVGAEANTKMAAQSNGKINMTYHEKLGMYEHSLFFVHFHRFQMTRESNLVHIGICSYKVSYVLLRDLRRYQALKLTNHRHNTPSDHPPIGQSAGFPGHKREGWTWPVANPTKW